MHVDAARIVAIRSTNKRGSGFLITPRLILTAAHVIEVDTLNSDGPTQIAAFSSSDVGVIECDVIWRSKDGEDSLDIALLLAKKDVVPEEIGCEFLPVTWGKFDNLEPRNGCFATGFPVVGRDPGTQPRVEQFWGTLAPATDSDTGRYVLSTGAIPPSSGPNENSPWAGFSGAAVFFRKFLVGVVIEDDRPGRWKHSRVAVASSARLLEDASFRDAITTHSEEKLSIRGISDEEIIDQAFEERYAQAIRAEHGKIRIFGLDLSRSTGRGLDLDTAYLSLEAIANDVNHQDVPQQTRIDTLLGRKQRILLRGQAGSGKSTLIQWIATKSISGALDGDLSALNGRIPFVLRLRAMFRLDKLRPNPSEFLQIGNIPIADDQPAGWADRVMREGRALLLVDGMDEIPDDSRSEAREWLGWMLEHYPRVWALVTVRPSAVPRDWLAEYGFRELILSPMDRADRQIFIKQWHKAAFVEASAIASSTPELERVTRELSDLEKGLLRSLEVTPQLAALTDSPLLCAMICALHRDRSGALPSGRMEIYRAALGMLLARRDQERQVDLQLEEDEQRSVLQEIAAWLVNEGLAEGGKTDAINQISRILPSLNRVNISYTPEKIYDHIVDRSGLITETSTETFEFIHRTFQDYLAAQEFKEARSFSMLAGHAHDEQWDDVIRMTVGHGDHRDRADLLEKIVQAGDAEDDDAFRRRIYLLAGSCLPYASRLDGQVRQMVLDRVRSHLPKNYIGLQEAEKFATVGDDIISLIPPNAVKPWALQVLGRLRTDRAFQFLREIAASLDEECLRQLGSIWESFDIERFSADILTRVDCTKIPFWVDNHLQVIELCKRGPIGQVTLDCIRGFGVASALEKSDLHVRDLTLVNSGANRRSGRNNDLNFLHSINGLESLGFLGCRLGGDLSVVREFDLKSLAIVDSPLHYSFRLEEVIEPLSGLVELSIGRHELASLNPAASLSRIKTLSLWQPPRGAKFLRHAAELFPNVETLEIRVSFEKKRQVLDITPFASRGKFHLIVRNHLPPIIKGRGEFADGCLTVEIKN
ncbi:NACHT domain-containing protein [Streptomyces sp. NBC_01455]|uniref:NACHT domain-containing protein n=1 Tax=Streptomyces sp. NBC_01455 TaxID=2903874 RepID=UPI002E33EE7C|nr:NACHT domain-containing protein [Streptomyces sp. NBC_01455]